MHNLPVEIITNALNDKNAFATIWEKLVFGKEWSKGAKCWRQFDRYWQWYGEQINIFCLWYQEQICLTAYDSDDGCIAPNKFSEILAEAIAGVASNLQIMESSSSN
jgi:hypothetical protein